MKSRPVEPARIEFGEVPYAPDFGDLYHPRIGAWDQAQHVFLGGNGVPQRWRGRERFVVLETGFGLGNNFLATWDAWRADPERSRHLVYVSIDRHPPRQEDLRRAHAAAPSAALAQQLVQAWPPLTSNLHSIDFEGGRLRLLLAFGDVADWLPELTLAADAIYLDGFAPARNPEMWTPGVLKAVGRRAAAGATAATWSVARELREGLVTAGFEVASAPGIGGKREITVARYRPRFERPAARPTGPQDALVIGAGVAGACTAAALAAEGWAVTVLDRHAQPASENSGQAGGIFHGTVHANGGPHARLLRTAALLAQTTIAPLVRGGVPGRPDGLIRLGGRDLDAMQALVERQRLPPEWAQALDAPAASALAGVTLREPCWFFPGGGWVKAPALVRALLAQPGIRFVGGHELRSLLRRGERWQALDGNGHAVAEATALVVANAAGAAELLAPFGWSAPMQPVRGQTSSWTGATTLLQRALAGDGYALPLPEGGLLCGATNSEGDEAAVRESDHEANFERLGRLTGLLPPADRARWQGRVGWRLQTADRMPVAGAVPLATAPAIGAEQARRWPRVEGLYVCTALGGRGITLGPLLGRLLAAQIAGSPLPLEQSLVDAVDPVRWRVRSYRAGT